jgi:hypothetical protein
MRASFNVLYLLGRSSYLMLWSGLRTGLSCHPTPPLRCGAPLAVAWSSLILIEASSLLLQQGKEIVTTQLVPPPGAKGGDLMRFYNQQHRYYCGIDLHARRMYICVLDVEGKILVHRNCPATPEHLLKVLAPYREDVAVAVECTLRLRSGHTFTWYWLADLCSREGIPFVLGRAPEPARFESAGTRAPMSF